MCSPRLSAYILYALNSVVMFLGFFGLILSGMRYLDKDFEIVPRTVYLVLMVFLGMVTLLAIGGVCSTCYQMSQIYREYSEDEYDYDHGEFQGGGGKSCFLLFYAALCFMGCVATAVGIVITLSFLGEVKDVRQAKGAGKVRNGSAAAIGKLSGKIATKISELINANNSQYHNAWVEIQDELACCGYDVGDNSTETGTLCADSPTKTEKTPFCKTKLLNKLKNNLDKVVHVSCGICATLFLACCAALHLRCCAGTVNSVMPYDDDYEGDHYGGVDIHLKLKKATTTCTSGNWQERWDSTTGNKFYYNTKTSLSQWKPPSDFHSSRNPDDAWDPVVDDNNKVIYYFNHVTKEKRQDAPHAHLRDVSKLDEHRVMRLDHQTGNPDLWNHMRDGAQAQGGGITAGWQQFNDPKSGRMFYYNKTTKQSRWTKP